MTRLSPLGLPLPETFDQAVPTMGELARGHGTNRDRGGEEIRHICMECGGPLASGLILVQTCRVCGGVGTLSDDQMDALGAGRLVLP